MCPIKLEPWQQMPEDIRASDCSVDIRDHNSVMIAIGVIVQLTFDRVVASKIAFEGVDELVLSGQEVQVFPEVLWRLETSLEYAPCNDTFERMFEDEFWRQLVHALAKPLDDVLGKLLAECKQRQELRDAIECVEETVVDLDHQVVVQVLLSHVLGKLLVRYQIVLEYLVQFPLTHLVVYEVRAQRQLHTGLVLCRFSVLRLFVVQRH